MAQEGEVTAVAGVIKNEAPELVFPEQEYRNLTIFITFGRFPVPPGGTAGGLQW